MTMEYKKQCQAALYALLDYFAGNKSQMATVLGVSRNAVTNWFMKGAIGKSSALAVDEDPMIPFTKEDLRPDVKYWAAYKRRGQA
jgi:DNA-binding transcriptional regulator YdaS (Cro superfamily)